MGQHLPSTAGPGAGGAAQPGRSSPSSQSIAGGTLRRLHARACCSWGTAGVTRGRGTARPPGAGSPGCLLLSSSGQCFPHAQRGEHRSPCRGWCTQEGLYWHLFPGRRALIPSTKDPVSVSSSVKHNQPSPGGVAVRAGGDVQASSPTTLLHSFGPQTLRRWRGLHLWVSPLATLTNQGLKPTSGHTAARVQARPASHACTQGHAPLTAQDPSLPPTTFTNQFTSPTQETTAL